MAVNVIRRDVINMSRDVCIKIKYRDGPKRRLDLLQTLVDAGWWIERGEGLLDDLEVKAKLTDNDLKPPRPDDVKRAVIVKAKGRDREINKVHLSWEEPSAGILLFFDFEGTLTIYLFGMYVYLDCDNRVFDICWYTERLILPLLVAGCDPLEIKWTIDP